MRIAIVGGGPAGAMAAIRLARAGAAVTIFDASHPREKACGGGLTGRALSLIADVVDVAALPAVVVRSAIVEEPVTVRLKADATGVEVTLRDQGLSPGSSLVVLSRASFDKALLDAALARGAQLVAETVIDVARASQMKVRTTVREYAADFLI